MRSLMSWIIPYVMDDPARAVSLAASFGGYFLSPGEAAQLLPHYPGFGANLTGSGEAGK